MTIDELIFTSTLNQDTRSIPLRNISEVRKESFVGVPELIAVKTETGEEIFSLPNRDVRVENIESVKQS